MKRNKPFEFKTPWLILCEGSSDKIFFDGLIAAKGLSSKFYVQFPDREGSSKGGVSKYENWLRTAYVASSSFKSNVEAVIVVADKDDDADASFREVQRQLQATEGFPIPSSERTLARKENYPAVAILMIPIEELGNLETLCLRSANDKWHLSIASEKFLAASPAANWSISKQSKAKLNAIIAVTCEANPDASLAQHWREHINYHVPRDHECFKAIARFLEEFKNLLQGS